MKLFFFALFSVTAFSQDLTLPDYQTVIRDIQTKKTTKEKEFQKLNRSLIKVNDSICSNRAAMWAWDFKLRDIDSAKVFLFFTPKTSRQEGIYWWYHVAPALNENGQWWVLDGGYPRRFKRPISLDGWLKNFNGLKSVCKELKREDEDLIENIFFMRSFPETTPHGKFNCYYKITPAGYWTPNQVALNLLGRNSQGRPVNFQRDEINSNEVFAACLEASTTPLGYAWGSNENKCRAFLRHGSQN